MRINRRGDGPEGFNTTAHQAQQVGPATFRGQPVIAGQYGRCPQCRCDITSLLVGKGAARRWINTETSGPADVEHTCASAA